MARTHVVKAGDHVPKLAAAAGFRQYEPVWNHPANQGLGDDRTPCILNPGDEVFIPDSTPTKLSLATGQSHRFVVKGMELHLRMAILDASRKPVAGATGELRGGGGTFPITLDGQGHFDQIIPVTIEACDLIFDDRKFSVLVGHLAPAGEPDGWRQRLNNLGYFAGTGGDDDEVIDDADEDGPDGPDGDDDEAADDLQLRSAIEEFQCDNAMKVTGQRDAATQAKLVEIHGC